MKIVVVSAAYLVAFNQRKWEELRALDDEISVKILTPERLPTAFGHRRRERLPGFDVASIPRVRSYFNRSHMHYLFSPVQLANILRSFQPDRIHIEEDPYSAVGFQVITFARIFARRAKISFFIWDNLNRKPEGPKGHLKYLLNRFGLSRCDLVVCGNREAQRLLYDEKAYRGQSVVLPQLGLTASDYADGPEEGLRAEMGAPAGSALIGFVGRFVPEKGIETLLNALERLPNLDWRLLLLGSGPMEGEIRSKWVVRLGNRLIMPGAVPHEKVPHYMRALDVLVLPSRSTPEWVEQFGIVLAQAMLAGVPCIGSSSGAIPEVIGPGGVTFQEGNVDELAGELRKLIGAPNMRKCLGEAAQRYAMAHYTQQVVARAYWKEFVALSG